MELRGKIAMEADALIVQKLGDAFEWDSWHGMREECAAAIADAILQIPEIKEALEARRINAMSPSQFGAMLLDQLPDARPKT